MLTKPIYRTLRFRLTIWNTIVLLAASLLALIAAREGMRITLANETRDLLREETLELELAVKQFYPDIEEIKSEFSRKVRGHRQHDWFAELTDQQQKIVFRSEEFPDLADSGLKFASDVRENFELQQDRERIVIRHRVELANGAGFLILLGTPTEFIQRDVWSLTKVLLAIGGVLFLVAPLGGYSLARHATNPVREIIETTRRLDPANLKHRLPIRGTNDELDQLSEEINYFLDQISKYLHSHREFVTNAAHELRSPLTAIQTSVDVALEKERTADEYREQLDIVSEECEQLRHLVNQLLQLAETDVENQKMKLAEFDFSELVNRSAEFFSVIAEENGIRIESNLGSKIYLHGNDSKIRQVVNNLLDNALKFTPGGGVIKLDLLRKNGFVWLEVCDSGCGIPSDELSKIFDRFYQVDHSRSRANRIGNGLGLSICKSIVEMHGGKIEAENNSPHGTRVRVVLPA